MKRIFLVAGIPIIAGVALMLALNPFQSATPQLPQIIPQEKKVLDPSMTYDYIVKPVNYTAVGKDVGIQYPPAAMANKCLFYFSHLRNQTAWDYGVYMADWMALRNPDMQHRYDFDWKPYNLTKGWTSALGQAHTAECFIRAYDHTNNTKYLEYAKASFIQMPRDGDWYEEYPGGSHVLNGHQFVLLALSKYPLEDAEIKGLLDRGLAALKADALLYDNGTNSFYDRLGHPALKYHNTHVVNFQRIYDYTKDAEWLEIKTAFES